MTSERGGTMTQRKPERNKNRAFQVRMTDSLADAFTGVMERLEAGVKNTQGIPLTRTDLVEYWLTWLTRLSPKSQARWAEAYRDDFMLAVKGLPPAEEVAVAREGAASPPSGTIVVRPPSVASGSLERAPRKDDQTTKREPKGGRRPLGK